MEKQLNGTKLKVNDVIKVLCGKDKGKEGKILKIDRQRQVVSVAGINMVKKTMRKKKQDDKGGIVEIEHPLHISNVQLISKKQGSRLRYITAANGEKKRQAIKTGETL